MLGGFQDVEHCSLLNVTSKGMSVNENLNKSYQKDTADESVLKLCVYDGEYSACLVIVIWTMFVSVHVQMWLQSGVFLPRSLLTVTKWSALLLVFFKIVCINTKAWIRVEGSCL